MHRVELKACKVMLTLLASTAHVPNAPCGVESKHLGKDRVGTFSLFLMHRVELKVPCLRFSRTGLAVFLMHRVELKGKQNTSLSHGTPS